MEKIQKHYNTIDGLRTLACVGIVMMHIAANNDYQIEGFLYKIIIPSFTDFVFLFMTISAFGMCCGYYEKVINQNISIEEFYSKRFRKVWSFFAILVVLDVLLSPSVDALYEAFADLTLLFGFLPHAGYIEVIGVGWFLGIIFVFYLIFPFFCYLIADKRRAWVSFGISLIYNIVCAEYFDVGRQNILYSGCFFLAGGLIYLYRGKIAEVCEKGKSQWFMLVITLISIALYYLLDGGAMCCLMVSIALLVYALMTCGGAMGRYWTIGSRTSLARLAWRFI